MRQRRRDDGVIVYTDCKGHYFCRFCSYKSYKLGDSIPFDNCSELDIDTWNCLAFSDGGVNRTIYYNKGWEFDNTIHEIVISTDFCHLKDYCISDMKCKYPCIDCNLLKHKKQFLSEILNVEVRK